MATTEWTQVKRDEIQRRLRERDTAFDTMLAEHIAALQSRIDALTADAERLDWLEARGWLAQFSRTHGRPEHQRWFDSETVGSDYSPTLRAAIDAARHFRPPTGGRP